MEGHSSQNDKPVDSRFDQMTPEAHDKASKEKKEILLTSLQTLVAEEIKKDSTFNITMDYIKKVTRQHPELFLKLGYAAVMRYFSNDINFLRGKLGLPEVISKKQKYKP